MAASVAMNRARLVLAWTVPLAFVGVIVGKTINDRAVIDATVAGGLIAILGTIVAGVFNNNSNDKRGGD